MYDMTVHVHVYMCNSKLKRLRLFFEILIMIECGTSLTPAQQSVPSSQCPQTWPKSPEMISSEKCHEGAQE